MTPRDFQSLELINFSTNAAAFVILYYDFFLTLGTEVDRYWTPGPWNVISTLFFLNRYLGLLGNLPVAYQILCSGRLKTWEQPQSELNLTLYHEILILILQLLVAALMSLRTYALYNRAHAVTVVLCLSAATFVTMSVYLTISTFHTIMQGNPVDTETGRRIALAFGFYLVHDTIVFVLTTFKAIRLYNQRKHPLLQALYVDGLLFYSMIVLFSMLNLLFLSLADIPLKTIWATPTNVVSVVMVSRLALNMRHPSIMRPMDADGSPDDHERADDAYISSVVDAGMTMPSELHALQPRTRYRGLGDLGQGQDDRLQGYTDVNSVRHTRDATVDGPVEACQLRVV